MKKTTTSMVKMNSIFEQKNIIILSNKWGYTF